MSWKTESQARQTVCPHLKGGNHYNDPRTLFCCKASECGLWLWNETDTGEHGNSQPLRGRCGLINDPRY